MAIVFRSSSVAADGAGPTSLLITKPAGVVDGDFLLAFVVIAGERTVNSAPAGWTQVDMATTGVASGDARQYVYQKFASSEGANYTWGFSGTTDAAIAILAYTGVNTTSPVQDYDYDLMAGSTVTMTAPGIQTLTDNTVLVSAFGVNPGVVGNLTFSTPSGTTPRAEADPAGATTNRAVLAVFDQDVATAAVMSSETTTISDLAKGVGFSVVLGPTGAQPTEVTVQPQTATSIAEGCMIGWYDHGGYDAAKDNEALLDTHFAIIRVYHSPTQFPTIKSSTIDDIVDDGRLVMVSHKPPKRGGAWIEIHKGDHSASIDAWVSYYKALDTEIIFIFHHEPHDDTTDLKEDKPGIMGEATDYVKAYRYIAKKFRDANADKVLLGYCAVANPWAIKGTPTGSGDECYPGDDVVDVICHDEYNIAGEDFDPDPSGGGTTTVTFVGENHSARPKGSSSVTLNVPSAAEEDDLLLAILHTDYCNIDSDPPSGWSLLMRREEPYDGAADPDPLYGGTDLCGYVFYKISNGSETSVTFHADNEEGDGDENLITATLMVFRNVDTSNPIYDSDIDPQSPNQQIDAPSVSGLDGGMLICAFIEDNPRTLSVPSGMTQVATYKSPPEDPDDCVMIAYKALTSTGSTGVKTSYLDTGVPNDMAFSISLKPGGSGVYAYGGSSWNSFEEEYARVVALAKEQNKPLIFGEIGSNHSKPQGDRGEWFRDGADWIEGNQDARDYLKGFCYYHVDNHDNSGHWWRFVGEDTMFAGDGVQGFKDAFSNRSYFKTEPFSLITESPVSSAVKPSGIVTGFAVGNATVSSLGGPKTILGAGGIASPADYDLREEEPGQEFGLASVTTLTIISPSAIASAASVGNPVVTRGVGAGWIFEPPISHFTGGVTADTHGVQFELFKYYRGAPVGQNVYVMSNGEITTAPFDLNEIAHVYHGGHIITITDEEEIALRAAGYGAFITAIPPGG